MAGRIGGAISFKVDGIQYLAKGNFTYSIGAPKRESVVGADGVHGYKEAATVPYVEGEITDTIDVSLDKLANSTNITVILDLANGKSFVLSKAFYAGELKASTDEGNISVRFEGEKGEEVK